MNIEKTIVFVGKSGCGKGTQVKLLMDYLKEKGEKVLLTESGSRFRDLMNGDGYVSKKVKHTIDNGFFLPDIFPIWTMADTLINDMKEESQIVFLDAVLRSKGQATAMEEFMQFLGREKYIVLNIEVGDDWSRDRLLSRGRHDDTEEKINHRLGDFRKSVLPMLEYMRENSAYSVLDINGEQSIEEVHTEIMNKLGLQ